MTKRTTQFLHGPAATLLGSGYQGSSWALWAHYLSTNDFCLCAIPEPVPWFANEVAPTSKPHYRLARVEAALEVVLGVSWSTNQATCTPQSKPKYGTIKIVSGRDFNLAYSNLKRTAQLCLASERPSQSCDARTRRGTAYQKPPLTGKIRFRLHGGLSTGLRTAEGRVRIAAVHFHHGRRSAAYI